MLLRYLYDYYFLDMSLCLLYRHTFNHGNFPMTNINYVQEIKHFTSQQVADKPTALSNKEFLCMYLYFSGIHSLF